jgi:hypothetical protein
MEVVLVGFMNGTEFMEFRQEGETKKFTHR